MKKCNYYRANYAEDYSPECIKGETKMHPACVMEHICPFCGRPIQFRDYIMPPWVGVKAND